jgi:DNA replication protein DnaC
MTTYIIDNNQVQILSEDSVRLEKQLPPITYLLQFHKMRGYYLESQTVSYDFPDRIYGDTIKHVDRIITTFESKIRGTGILLEGVKGSGKTLTTQLVSKKMQQRGVPTIIVNEKFNDSFFVKLIQDIQQPCVIIFDEFEKVYPEKDDQHALLTLLDGVFSSKKLFMFTVNDVMKMDKFFLNRTGRIHYRFTYQGVSEPFIREYCQENLTMTQNLDQEIDKICKMVKLFKDFSFDNLQGLVWEMNTYNETALQAIENLNLEIDPFVDHESYSIVQLIIAGVEIETKKRQTHFYGNPYLRETLSIDHKSVYTVKSGPVQRKLKSNQDIDIDSDDEWSETVFHNSHLIEFNATLGEFVYFDKENNNYLKIRKEQKSITKTGMFSLLV